MVEVCTVVTQVEARKEPVSDLTFIQQIYTVHEPVIFSALQSVNKYNCKPIRVQKYINSQYISVQSFCSVIYTNPFWQSLVTLPD